MKKKIKYIIAGSVAGVLAVGGIIYAVQPDSVETAVVTRQDVTQYVKGTGTISADESITVYAPVAGKLSSVSYTEGDAVNTGDLLAEYDLASYTNAYNLAVGNEDYYTDGYDAAVKESNKAQSKYNNAAENSNDLKQQYTQIQSEIDAMDKAQAGKSQDIASRMQRIESLVATMEAELEIHQAKSSEAGSEKSIIEAQVAVLNGQSSEYQRQIAAQEALYDTLMEEINNSSTSLDRINAIRTEQQSITESLAQLEAEKALVDAQISPLNSKITSLEQKVSEENASVESLMRSIAANRYALALLPVEGMSESEYAKYAALLQKLDLIDREWSENLNSKGIAEEKILNDSQIAQYKDSVEIARLEREYAEYNLNQAESGVKSECNGVIIEKLVNKGASVEAGQELYVIQPTDGYKVSIMISKYDIEKISVGQSAEIVQGNTVFKGQVSKIYMVAETDASGKPKVKVDILLNVGDTKPIIGLETEVTINAGSSTQTLAVPDEAVYADDGGDYVYILDNKKVAKRYVTVGNKGISNVEILDGLDENDHVITTVMTDGQIGTKYREK